MSVLGSGYTCTTLCQTYGVSKDALINANTDNIFVLNQSNGHVSTYSYNYKVNKFSREGMIKDLGNTIFSLHVGDTIYETSTGRLFTFSSYYIDERAVKLYINSGTDISTLTAGHWSYDWSPKPAPAVQYVSEYLKANKPIPSGVYVNLPGESGGSGSSTAVNRNTYSYVVNHANIKNLYSSYASKFNCYINIYESGAMVKSMYIPVYPNEFSDSNSANFSSTSVLGRAVDYQTYNGSSRSVSLSLELHEELCSDYNYIHELVATLESACYPGYTGALVDPPEIMLVIGDHFKIRGVMESVGTSWKAPIINGKLVNCSVSINIRETTGPYSLSEIARMGGKRS